MTTLEKAEAILKTRSCANFLCGMPGDIDECPYIETCGLSISETKTLPDVIVEVAQKYINEHKEPKMQNEALKPGTRVYVSDESESAAIEDRECRYYICPTTRGRHYCITDMAEERYLVGDSGVYLTAWKYVVHAPVKEMTIAEVEKALGYPIKIKD